MKKENYNIIDLFCGTGGFSYGFTQYNNKFKVVATSLDTENSIYDIDYNKKVIVIGNEANGVTREVQEMADNKVKIPMLGKTESLNASVATGIMLYEYVRQKLNK